MLKNTAFILSASLAFTSLISCGQNSSSQKKEMRSHLTGAGFQSSNALFNVQETWLQGPSSISENTLLLKFQDAQGNPIQGVKVLKVSPWMKIHGHGAPEGGIRFAATETLGSEWKVEGLEFTMTGPWELRVEASVGEVTDFVEVTVDVKD